MILCKLFCIKFFNLKTSDLRCNSNYLDKCLFQNLSIVSDMSKSIFVFLNWLKLSWTSAVEYSNPIFWMSTEIALLKAIKIYKEQN